MEVELGFERLKGQALDLQSLNLIERWHGVGAVIQERKEGETWPGKGQTRAQPLGWADSEERTKSASASLVGFPSSKRLREESEGKLAARLLRRGGS